MIVLLHLLVLVLRPLRRAYGALLPDSLFFSIGAVVGWMGGLLLVGWGAPPFFLPLSPVISGLCAVPALRTWNVRGRGP